MIPFSILDLCSIVEGGDAALAFKNTVDLAQRAEKWGFNRFWLAEHHGMPGIGSAATSVLMAHVGHHTKTIRIGAGGIMLPNHSPLVIAEQFGTLESLFPGRVDLGLGRAPGSDQLTARALRRSPAMSADEFPQDVVELMNYFEPEPGRRSVRATPGEGLKIPIWILGSSLFGAQLAAELGLPYAFASHFAPGLLMPALKTYRERFKPSPRLDKPYVMLGYNIFAADTGEEAEHFATSMQQSIVALQSGFPGRLKPPVPGYLDTLSPSQRAGIEQFFACTATGTADQVRESVGEFLEATRADELIVTSTIYDHKARLRSVEIAAEILKSL